MRRFRWLAACTLAMGLVSEVTAQGTAVQIPPAQGQYVRPPVSPYPRPAVSPYMNLSRPGGTALNYYNLVRPQQEFQSSLQVLDQRADVLGQTLEDGRVLGPTGQASQFMTHSRYFFNLGSTRPAAVRPAVSPPAVLTPLRPGN